jgi:hypothetical protein
MSGSRLGLRSVGLFFAALTVGHAGDAQSQTYFCDRPRKPDLPSGYFEQEYSMRAAEFEVNEFFRKIRLYTDCLSDESTDAVSEARRVKQEWDAAVSAFNSRPH